MNREQMRERIASLIINRSRFDATADRILDLFDGAERNAAEKALRQAADDFEVTASLGGSVISQLRKRADEIAQGIR